MSISDQNTSSRRVGSRQKRKNFKRESFILGDSQLRTGFNIGESPLPPRSEAFRLTSDKSRCNRMPTGKWLRCDARVSRGYHRLTSFKIFYRESVEKKEKAHG
jgi:hypothetical protein